MSKEFKTLVIISPGFPANEADTTCMPAQQIFVRTLNQLFPEVKIIIIAFQYPFFKGEYQWYGNTVISFDGLKLKRIGRPMLWFNVYAALRRIHKTLTIDGLLSFWCSETALIGRRFSRAYAVPHFCWILGQDARKENWLVRWICPRGEELIALSPFLQKEFHKNHRITPKYIVPNGVAVPQFKPLTDSREIDILGVGSLIPLKQYFIFIDTIHRLKEYFPEIKAVLCGKGPEEGKLKRQIKDLNLHQNITLTGEVPHEKILETMQRAKVLLHPSSYEGYSTVCLEALYAGCHVVSFWAAEENPVEHWHVVKDQEEITKTCLSLLQAAPLDNSPVMIHRMEDSVTKIMTLYGYRAAHAS